jgi:hypothetical protein
MKELNLKDNSVIKKAYQIIGEHESISRVYFVLWDGSVICVNGSIKENPACKILPNLKTDIARYGGECHSCNKGIIVGRQYNRMEWYFNCVECDKEVVYSDNQVDEIVFNALSKII